MSNEGENCEGPGENGKKGLASVPLFEAEISQLLKKVNKFEEDANVNEDRVGRLMAAENTVVMRDKSRRYSSFNYDFITPAPFRNSLNISVLHRDENTRRGSVSDRISSMYLETETPLHGDSAKRTILPDYWWRHDRNKQQSDSIAFTAEMDKLRALHSTTQISPKPFYLGRSDYSECNKVDSYPRIDAEKEKWSQLKRPSHYEKGNNAFRDETRKRNEVTNARQRELEMLDAPVQSEKNNQPVEIEATVGTKDKSDSASTSSKGYSFEASLSKCEKGIVKGKGIIDNPTISWVEISKERNKIQAKVVMSEIRDMGVKVQEVDNGQLCLSCDKCQGFEAHLWRNGCRSKMRRKASSFASRERNKNVCALQRRSTNLPDKSVAPLDRFKLAHMSTSLTVASLANSWITLNPIMTSDRHSHTGVKPLYVSGIQKKVAGYLPPN